MNGNSRDSRMAEEKKSVQTETPCFEAVFEEFKDIVYRLAMGIVGNPDDAAEISQEVFIKIYRNLDGFKGDSSIQTWVYSVTRNTALSYRKKRNIRKMSTLNSEINQNLAQTKRPSDMAGWLESEEAKDQINKSITSLPAEQQQAITLYYFQGMSTRQIAELLEWGESKIKSLLFRARKSLFVLLVQYNQCK
ncbi:RNA polymerase sigma factor [Planctomycetota bacterium]